MYSKTNKVLSIAMSAAILLTNIMTPMKVYADEVNEPAQDLESEMPLETEPVSYYLTLPYYEEVSYSVDKNHMETKDSQDKNIRLAYHEEEKVEFSFQTADTVQVMEIHLKDNEKQEVPFSIDENRKVSLAMPAKDLDLTLVLEDIPVPAPAPETEQTVAAESTIESPVSQDEGINEFDLTAQEVSGDQYLYPSDDGTQDSNQNGQTDGNAASIEDQETGSGQQPTGAGPEADLEGEDVPLNDVAEGSGETAGESNPETPGIVLTAETEADGLPSQGSILTVDTLTIPLMDVDFNPETDFTHISFSPETDQIELVSDEVDITTPGTYSTIYRVTHDNGAKMWYVLRPVQVSENTGVRESETESTKDSHGSSEDETEEAEEEPDEPLPAEAITEADTEMEESMIVSESEIAADETEELPSAETVDEETTEEALEEMTESITEEVTEVSEESPAAGPYKVSAFADDNIAVTFDHEDGVYESGDEVRFSLELIKEMEEPTVIEEITADFDNGVSVTQEIRVNEDSGAVTFENVEPEKDVVVEDLPEADPLADPGPEDDFQLSYEESEDVFSFEMPESNVMLTMMSAPLLAAAAEEDDDPVPGKFKLIVKNAVTAPASLSSGFSASKQQGLS